MARTPAGRPGSLLQWREYQSPHFVFRYPPNSFAEKNVAVVAPRLEAARDAMVQMFQVDDAQSQQIVVYLGDMLDSLPAAPRPATPAVPSRPVGRGTEPPPPARELIPPEGATVVSLRRPPAPGVLLEIISGPGTGTTFEVRETGATIGRSIEHSIALADSEASRRHSRIEFRDGAYWLTDQGSTNGTFVNEVRVEAAHPLQTGDVIEVGTTRLGVTLSGEPPREPYQPPRRLGDGMGSDPARRQIRAVYRSDSPGEGLERSLVELLLVSWVGEHAAQSPMLVDGVTGCVMQVGDRLDPDRINTTLIERQRGGAQIALADALGGPAAVGKELYHLLSTSFVTFLLRIHGPEQLLEFVRQFDGDAPTQAAEAVYRKPLAVLEQEWLTSLRETLPTPLGILSFLRRSVIYLRPYWRENVLIFLGLLVSLAFMTLLPLSYSYLIDEAITPRNFGLLMLIIGGLTALFVVNTLTTLGREYLSSRVGAHVLNDMRLQMFEHLQRLSMGFYTQSEVGDIMSRLSNDLAVVEGALTRVLTTGFFLLLSLIVSTTLLFVLEWRLALICMVALPLFFLGPRLFGSRAAEASLQRQNDASRVAVVVQENLGAQAVIKAFSLQETSVARFRAALAQLAGSTIRATYLASLLGTTVSLSAFFVDLVALGVGAYLVINDQLTVGVLFAFLGLLANVVSPLQSMSDIVEVLQQATGGMQRVDALLNERPQIADAPDARPLQRPSREIRFEDVTFSYTGEQVNLDRVNLSIPVGASVAVVGPSGCGKSTILNLIMRFYDPTTGVVTIDGQGLRGLTQESLHRAVAAVPQESFLFNTTIRENIRMGRLDATDEEVEAAAKAAEIHDFIQGLPQGYDTVVGERGGRLSGGQRQRMAIARAILCDPAILVLDEATSALDPGTEAAISATLEKLAGGRTMVTVTHRLSSIVKADRIFVLEGGCLVEQGTHAELLKVGGLYARLWEQQNGLVVGAGAQYLGVEASRLQAVPFFKNLDGVLLAALANRIVTRRYAEGETIFEEGEAADSLYVILRGQVDVSTIGPAGKERRLAMLRDGDYFGEMALLHDLPRTATVRARASTLLLALDREQFHTLLNTVPDLRRAFERVVEARWRENLAAVSG